MSNDTISPNFYQVMFIMQKHNLSQDLHSCARFVLEDNYRLFLDIIISIIFYLMAKVNISIGSIKPNIFNFSILICVFELFFSVLGGIFGKIVNAVLVDKIKSLDNFELTTGMEWKMATEFYGKYHPNRRKNDNSVVT